MCESLHKATEATKGDFVISEEAIASFSSVVNHHIAGQKALLADLNLLDIY